MPSQNGLFREQNLYQAPLQISFYSKAGVLDLQLEQQIQNNKKREHRASQTLIFVVDTYFL